MGIAWDQASEKLALACEDEVVLFRNSTQLATHYPAAQNRYDALFMPRLTYHTGMLDLHDLHFSTQGALYGINTAFSCMMKLTEDYSFEPVWQPHFIDALVTEDRCHLNGLAMKDGQPKYVTAFNAGNTAQSWREDVTHTGILMDVDFQKIIIDELPMPHTPRIFNNELYCLLSATGELVRIDPQSGNRETLVNLGGFVRGMDYHNGYLFIGLSKLRKNSSTFSSLNLKADEAAIVIVHLDTRSIVGKITYHASLDEIYDIKILPGIKRPNILNTMNDTYKKGLSIPGATYWALSSNKNNLHE